LSNALAAQAGCCHRQTNQKPKYRYCMVKIYIKEVVIEDTGNQTADNGRR
jgi:hypothetical protein